MAYSFRKSDKTIEDGMRRIARSQVQKALSELDEAPRPEAIHQARKRCKKVRGLIRLVRPNFPDYDLENAAFRDATRLLSAARDRTALIEAFDRIAERFSDDTQADAFRTIREQLLDQRASLDDDAVDHALTEFQGEMLKARERIKDWKLKGDGVKAVEKGVKKTYKRAANRMDAARSDASGENLHEWRKRVKYHWYHARLLKRVWEPVMDGHRKEADRLADDLGDHHDLVVFEERIADNRIDIEGSAGELFAGILKTRRAELEAASFSRGALLFSERPKAIASRWRGYLDTH